MMGLSTTVNDDSVGSGTRNVGHGATHPKTKDAVATPLVHADLRKQVR
jgi:hypothetical protein